MLSIPFINGTRELTQIYFIDNCLSTFLLEKDQPKEEIHLDGIDKLFGEEDQNLPNSVDIVTLPNKEIIFEGFKKAFIYLIKRRDLLKVHICEAIQREVKINDNDNDRNQKIKKEEFLNEFSLSLESGFQEALMQLASENIENFLIEQEKQMSDDVFLKQNLILISENIAFIKNQYMELSEKSIEVAHIEDPNHVQEYMNSSRGFSLSRAEQMQSEGEK